MSDSKTWLGTRNRYARLRKIQTLDPVEDSREVARLFYEDFLSIQILPTLGGYLLADAAPRMSRILSASGELEMRVAKRFVDTSLLGRTVLRHGVRAPGPGREAARRVNAMHRSFDIHPDDFVAFGTGQVLMAIEIAERFGWRPVTDLEREALRVHYTNETRIFGGRVPLPPTLPRMRSFWETYLDEQLAFEPQNLRMAKRLLEFTATLFPAPIRPAVGPLLLAQIDPRIVRACGLSVPGPRTRAISTMSFRGLGTMDPLPDDAPDGLELLARKVYPNGYELGSLGTRARVDPAGDEWFAAPSESVGHERQE